MTFSPFQPLVASDSAAMRLLQLFTSSWRLVIALSTLQFLAIMAVPGALFLLGHTSWTLAPLALGALFEAARLWLKARLRERLRTRCLRSAASDALDKSSLVPESSVDSAFWAAYAAEYAISTDVPAILAGAAAAACSLALAWLRVGPTLVAPIVLLLLAAALLALKTQPGRARAMDSVIERRQATANWMAAAERDIGEVFGPRARAPYLQRVADEAAKWCRAEHVLERRKLLGRLGLGALILTGLLLILAAQGSDLSALRPGAALPIRTVSDVLLLSATVPIAFFLVVHTDSLLLGLTQLRALQPPARRTTQSVRLAVRPVRLTARDLYFRYGDSLALHVATLDVALVRPVVLIGPNGAGKTTFAALVAGVLSPSSGSIQIDGVQCLHLDRDQIAFVPQTPLMIEALSIAENVRLVVPQARSNEIRDRLLELGLDRDPESRAGSLSRGEQRRVAIARALMKQPELLILDEPDAWLDAAGRETLTQLMQRESEKRAVLLVSHRGDVIPEQAVILELGANHELTAPGDDTSR